MGMIEHEHNAISMYDGMLVDIDNLQSSNLFWFLTKISKRK